MIAARPEIDEAFLAALRTLDPTTREAGHGRWQMTMHDGRAFDVEERRARAWLSVECRPEQSCLGSPWRDRSRDGVVARQIDEVAAAIAKFPQRRRDWD